MSLEFAHHFTVIDQAQETRFRILYDDGQNRSYYPDEVGLPGPVLDDATYGMGIVEGAGAGGGSSFYSVASELYTVLQTGDTLYLAADDSINRVRIYDYSLDSETTYELNQPYAPGEAAPVSVDELLDAHIDRFVRIRTYHNDIQRSFHMVKRTATGGAVEGGYASAGGAFSSWGFYADTILLPGDSIFIAPDGEVDRIWVYDYLEEYFQYYDLDAPTQRGVLVDITAVLAPHMGQLIQLKAYNGATGRNFHLLKKGLQGGIVEGGQGNYGGSSFYRWYTELYAMVQKGDRFFVAANDKFNRIRVYDYSQGVSEEFSLEARFEAGQAADITDHLQKFINRLIRIRVYHYDAQRSFHMVKLSPQGDLVEGGYPDAGSSFNSWNTDMYVLLNTEDRLVVASSEPVNMVKVYDYYSGDWQTYELGGNLFEAYVLFDLTPYVQVHEGHLIRLQLFYEGSQKSFHLLKASPRATTGLAIHLSEGWNLVSFPIDGISDRPLEDVLKSLGDALVSAFGYSAANPANPWKSYDPAIPSFFNTLKSLLPEQAYWVRVRTDTTLTLDGNILPIGSSSWNVVEGWQLVGWGADTPGDPVEIAGALGGTVKIYRYDPESPANPWSLYDSTIPPFFPQSLKELVQGHGHWLYWEPPL